MTTNNQQTASNEKPEALTGSGLTPAMVFFMLECMISEQYLDSKQEGLIASAEFREEFGDVDPVAVGHGLMLAWLEKLSEHVSSALVRAGAFGQGPVINIDGQFKYGFRAKLVSRPAPGSLAAWFAQAKADGLFRPQFA